MSRPRVQCPECNIILKVRSEEMLSKRLRCPRCKFGFAPVALSDESLTKSNTSDAPKASEPALPVVDAESSRPEPPSRKRSSSSSASRSTGRRRSGSSGRQNFSHGESNNGNWTRFALGAVILGVTAVAGAWGFGLLAENSQDDVEPVLTSESVPVRNPEADAESPTSVIEPSGNPVAMAHMPIVPQVLLHLHPSEFWSSYRDRRELLATLGDLAGWLDEFIFRFTRFRPEDISELTLAVNFGGRTSDPDVVAVLRISQPAEDVAMLVERIKGKPVAGMSGDVYESGEQAFRFPDNQTVVVAGIDLAEDLALSATDSAVPPAEMETLIRLSDRKRPFTLIVDLNQIDVHRETVLAEPLRPLAEEVVIWFGRQSRMLSWSAVLEPHLQIETLVTHTAESSPRQLRQRLESQLEALPPALAAIAKSTAPRTVGRQQMIGRFPAMMEAFRLGTIMTTFDSGVRLQTVLPKKAAANLAAGATLTWNESARPGEPPTVVVTPDAPAVKSLQQQLESTVLAEFNREPLEDAMKFIAMEIGISLRIDGDALMLAGFTRNMPQTHQLGEVPAVNAIDAILSQYDGRMVVVLEEENRTIVLTTKAAADAAGLPVFDTKR